MVKNKRMTVIKPHSYYRPSSRSRYNPKTGSGLQDT